MFGRKARLTLRKGGGATVIDTITDLDIRFSIRKNSYFICDAKIDVLNPKREIMNQFAAHIGMYKESTEERLVTLEVGWESGGEMGKMRPIFDGVVMSAMPSSYPPDIWFSMQCIGRAYSNIDIPTDSQDMRIRYSDSDLTVSSVLSKLAGALSKKQLTLKNEIQDKDILNKKLSSGFESTTKVRDLLKHIREIDRNLNVYADNAVIHVTDRMSAGKTVATAISKDTGMIGIPRCNWPNYFVETFFRSDIDIFNTVSVKTGFNIISSRLSGPTPGFSMSGEGEFRVMGITYSGQLRSGKWAMSLDLLQIDEARKNLNEESKKNTASNVKIK